MGEQEKVKKEKDKARGERGLLLMKITYTSTHTHTHTQSWWQQNQRTKPRTASPLGRENWLGIATFFLTKPDCAKMVSSVDLSRGQAETDRHKRQETDRQETERETCTCTLALPLAWSLSLSLTHTNTPSRSPFSLAPPEMHVLGSFMTWVQRGRRRAGEVAGRRKRAGAA